MGAVAAGVVVVELVVAGLPKIPDPKILLVELVVGALAVEVLLSPVAAVLPKVPDPKILLVAIVVEALAVEVLLSPVAAVLPKVPDPKMFPDPELDAGVGRLKRLMLIETSGSAVASVQLVSTFKLWVFRNLLVYTNYGATSFQ